MYHLRPATGADVLALSGSMRAADVREVEATGSDPLTALSDGLRVSDEPIVATYQDDRPICMAGVSADLHDPSIGYIWMLGSDELATRPMTFLRGARALVEHWNRQYPILTNVVDARNTLHIKWLRWMGFTFIARTPHGPEGLPFLHFVRISSDPFEQALVRAHGGQHL